MPCRDCHKRTIQLEIKSYESIIHSTLRSASTFIRCSAHDFPRFRCRFPCRFCYTQDSVRSATSRRHIVRRGYTLISVSPNTLLRYCLPPDGVSGNSARIMSYHGYGKNRYNLPRYGIRPSPFSSICPNSKLRLKV